MKRLFVFLVLFMTVVPWPSLAAFEPGVVFESEDAGLGVYVSEIMANPLDEDTGEFIELWNLSDVAVDIASWKLSDAGDAEDLIQDYVGTSDIGAPGTVIPPKGYALIVDSEYAGEYNAAILAGADLASFVMVTLNDSTLGNGLGNTADAVTITPAPVGVNVLTASWVSDAGNGVSWAGFSLLSSPQFVKSKQTTGSSPVQDNNMAPQAALETSAESGFAPLSLTFDASDSVDPEGLPLSFEMDFGDGVVESGSAANFAHAYNVGDFVARLKIVDSEGAESVIEKHIAAQQKVLCALTITEVFPNPEGSDTENEFIEILNAGSSACNLEGYKLDDVEGGSSPYELSEVEVAAGGYQAFFSKETKITLNNENESARLLDVDGNVVSEVLYGQSLEGKSYAKNGTAFEWTSKVTPSAANAFDAPTDPETDPEDVPENEESPGEPEERRPLSISEAKKLERNDAVIIEGFVIIKPGVASKNWFYVQDATGGMQIYSSKKEFPKIRVGQKVRVTGKISETKTGKRILIDSKDDVEIVRGEGLIKTILKKTGRIQASDEGSVIRLSGTVEKKQGSVIFVNDGSGTARVSVPAELLPDAKTIKKGEAVSLQGVVVQNSSGPTVVPRSKEDLSLSITSLPKAGASYVELVLVVIGMAGTALLALRATRSSQSIPTPSALRR